MFKTSSSQLREERKVPESAEPGRGASIPEPRGNSAERPLCWAQEDSAGARDPPGARDEASTSISFQWEGKNTNVQIMNPARIVVVLVTMMTQFRICCNGGRDARRQKCLARATLDDTELSTEAWGTNNSNWG